MGCACRSFLAANARVDCRHAWGWSEDTSDLQVGLLQGHPERPQSSAGRSPWTSETNDSAFQPGSQPLVGDDCTRSTSTSSIELQHTTSPEHQLHPHQLPSARGASIIATLAPNADQEPRLSSICVCWCALLSASAHCSLFRRSMPFGRGHTLRLGCPAVVLMFYCACSCALPDVNLEWGSWHPEPQRAG